MILTTALMLLVLPARAHAAGGWVLEQSTISYHVSHTLHESVGVSHAARGKAVCGEGRCQVLVAARVDSFDSGDSNRDLHMIQITRAALFPMIAVRTRVPEDPAATDLKADLEIQFSSRTVTYPNVGLHRSVEGARTRLTGTIPLKISDFGIEAPKLLTMPIKDDVPIAVDTLWRRE